MVKDGRTTYVLRTYTSHVPLDLSRVGPGSFGPVGSKTRRVALRGRIGMLNVCDASGSANSTNRGTEVMALGPLEPKTSWLFVFVSS